MTDTITVQDGRATVFSGPSAVNVYAMKVLAVGLEMYAKSGIMPNRAYSPKRMMAAAEMWTGKKFKSRDYIGAAKAVLLAADDLQREKVKVVRE